ESHRDAVDPHAAHERDQRHQQHHHHRRAGAGRAVRAGSWGPSHRLDHRPRRGQHRPGGGQHVRRLRRDAAHAADVPEVAAPMAATFLTVSYLGATILFILSLGGLSSPETSRRGNFYGMIGMTIAVLATVLGPHVSQPAYPWIIGAMLVGAAVGLYAARVVKMTQMPELVALMHSLVGLAAVLIGYANYIDPAATAHFQGAEKTIHELEIYIGVLIGAVT